MKQQLVSVIVPAYNDERFISKCLKSILCQLYSNIEILVIDDGSTDNTLLEVNRIAGLDSRVRVISQKNSGVSTARNNGIKEAKGEYILFIDADDYVANDYVSYLYNLVRNNNAEFGFSINLFSKRNEKQVIKDTVQILDSAQATALLMSTRVVVGSYNKIYKRDMLLKNRIFYDKDLFYGEGLSFITDVAQRTNKVVVGNRKTYYYRKNNINSATTKFDMKKVINGIKSVNRIKSRIINDSDELEEMFKLHLCIYYLAAAVNLINSNEKIRYISEYKNWMKFVRENTFSLLFSSNVSMYRKGILMVGNISPYLLARADKIRRKVIFKKSV